MTQGSNILIHTGNFLQIQDLKRKPGNTSAEELYDGLKIQLSNINSKQINEIEAPQELSPLLKEEERGSQKITVKLFLSTVKQEFVTDALDAALKELGALRADLFIISWPVGLNLDQTMELWNVMETLVDHNQADSLGVSDIETQAFIQLHSLARVKPEAIQINLESCCVVPAELVTFTREQNIQLLTHNDPQNILPPETLRSIMPSILEVHWTVRYQTLLRCRGIIQNKGYVIKAELNN